MASISKEIPKSLACFSHLGGYRMYEGLRRRLLDSLVPGSFPDRFYKVEREVIKNEVDFCFFNTQKSK